ncbi:MAG: porin [Bosea sp. (in: a-proteobacteria)]
MLHRLAMLFALSCVGTNPAAAQTLVEPIPGQRSHGLPKSQVASPAARPCPEYGAGFVRLEGSAGCVRVSGSVRAEYGVGRGSFGPSTGSASAVSGAAQIETRTPTAYGEVRTVVRGRGQINSGLPTTPTPVR